MRQHWIIVNLDRQEWAYGTPSDVLYTWTRTLFNCDEDLLVYEHFLPAPSVTIQKAPPWKDGQRKTIHTSLNSSIFFRLPVELYDCIFENFEDYFDSVCLGLTCRLLWDVARRHVRRHYAKAAPSSWAGDRIVCAGSCSRADEENIGGFLEEGEEQKFIASESTNLYEFVKEFYTPAAPRKCAKNLDSWADNRACNRNFKDEDWAALDTVLGMLARPIVRNTEQPRPRILCNLSQKVYVRQEALNWFNFSAKCSWPYCDHRTRIGFGHIIWMRTGWSSCCSVGMLRNPTKVHRGPWAGDRFDFAASKDLLETSVGDDGPRTLEWKDVSDEVVEEVTLLLKASQEESDSDDDMDAEDEA